jgi:predicted Ser/Thr protein kinase
MTKLLQKNNREEEKEKADIVAFLMENVYKQNKIDFYTKYISLTQS